MKERMLKIYFLVFTLMVFLADVRFDIMPWKFPGEGSEDDQPGAA
jgi:hypothetical protein